MANFNLPHSKPRQATLIVLLIAALGAPAVSLGICYTDTIRPATPSSQFVIHGDGTITDTTTSLMWKQCPEGKSSTDCSAGVAGFFRWDQALQLATTVNASGGFAGYSDWRLPNIAELVSIAETQCSSPAINSAVFPNTDMLSFWTNSPDSNNDATTWFVEFKYGNTGTANRTQPYSLRLVRDVE